MGFRHLMRAGLFLLGAASIAGAKTISLSGLVEDSNRSALALAKVTLALNGYSTSADSTGAWSMAWGISAIEPQATTSTVTATVTRHLVVEGGRLRIVLGGYDASGRPGESTAASSSRAVSSAARSDATAADTLLYSWNGRVRARIPVASITAGALGAQEIDTSTASSDIPWKASIAYGTVTDSRDGQIYRTVTIGSRTWMAEDLNYKIDSSWSYKDVIDSGIKYGRIYHWAGALDLADSCNTKVCSTQVVQRAHQGLCPAGWRVPSEDDWSRLVDTSLDSATAAKALKSSVGWDSSGSGTDAYGFRALPAGIIYIWQGTPGYYLAGQKGYYWCTREYSATNTWARGFYYSYDYVKHGNDLVKKYGLSLRCIKDD